MPGRNENSGYFRSFDGSKLFFRAVIPENYSLDCIIHHGLGEHQGRYDDFIHDLDLPGVRFFLMDARGHGQSAGRPGYAHHLLDMVRDLESFLYFLRLEFGAAKPFLLGHSLGGLIAASFALHFSNQWELLGLFLSAPAFEPHVSVQNAIKKEVGRILAPVAGDLVLPSGLNARYLSHDERVIRAYRADPLVHDQLGLRLGLSVLEMGKAALRRAGNLKIPLCVAHGSEDKIAGVDGAIAFFRAAAAADKKLLVYPGLFHEIFNESEPARSRVIQDARNWFLRQMDSIPLKDTTPQETDEKTTAPAAKGGK
ncbi:MAG: alpha/beta hydrolase [Spirochaetales bacterium]|nr:alpha/beta hydrolase [Spirochaetales bacterium]